MKTLKLLKATYVQEDIYEYIADSYNLIREFNETMKKGRVNEFMKANNFRNFKVMEKALNAAKEKSMRWFSISNKISNSYGTVDCNNDTYNLIIVKAIEKYI